MSKNRLIFLVFFVTVLAIIINALLEELSRNNNILKSSISGIIISNPEISKGIVKTDNAYILLFDPEKPELIAAKTVNPFLPPLTFSIGQEDSENPLSGSYRLLVITDKNRNVYLPYVGEVIGPLLKPIALGTEGIKYYLDRPFKNLPSELLISTNKQPETSISGTVIVPSFFLNELDLTDRLVIMLFEKDKSRPVAIKILSNFNPPQKFSIGQSNSMTGQILKDGYYLRILTDKNNQPFQSVPGELIGRSKELIPLGTHNLEFELDEEYIR